MQTRKHGLFKLIIFNKRVERERERERVRLRERDSDKFIEMKVAKLKLTKRLHTYV